jgi:hypothetical protein
VRSLKAGIISIVYNKYIDNTLNILLNFLGGHSDPGFLPIHVDLYIFDTDTPYDNPSLQFAGGTDGDGDEANPKGETTVGAGARRLRPSTMNRNFSTRGDDKCVQRNTMPKEKRQCATIFLSLVAWP